MLARSAPRLLSLFLVVGCGTITEPPGSDPAEIEIAVAPGNVFVREGTIASFEVTVTRGEGLAEAATVSASGVPGGVSIVDGYVGPDGDAVALVVDAEVGATQGEAIVSVTATSPGGAEAEGQLRLLVGGAPGTLDTSFAGDGTFNYTPDSEHKGRGAMVDDDGRILAFGHTPTVAFVLALLPDGTLDPAWGDGGVALSPVSSFSNCLSLIRTSAGLRCGGAAFLTDVDYAVHAFTDGGQVDTSFSDDGYTTSTPGEAAYDEATVIGEASNGDLIVAGPHFGATLDTRAYRYSSAGVEINTYVVDVAGHYPQAGFVDAQDRLIVAGSTAGNTWIARFTDDSTPDAGFASGGDTTEDLGGTEKVLGVVETSDGGYLLAAISSGEVATIRYDSGGDLVTDYGETGVARTGLNVLAGSPALNSAVLDSQDRLVIVATDADGPNPVAIRILPDGSPDYTFGTGGMAVVDFGVSGTDPQSNGFGVALDADDRIIVVGQRGPNMGQQILVGRLWP